MTAYMQAMVMTSIGGPEVLGGVYPSARISLGKEEVRCNGRKLFDGVQWVRLPPGKD